MRKKSSKITLLLLLLILCLYTTKVVNNNKTLANASPSILIVPDDFHSIQSAINNASLGDIIYVRPGIYHESIVINKGITLIGENRESTIIDGDGNVILIQASNVNISGFTIQNCGIYIERFGGVVISNNNIRGNNMGVQITLSSRNQIRENVISVNNVGVQLIYASGNIICKNDIRNNTRGVDIYYSIDNVFYENILFGNKWGVCLFYSDHNTFYHNNFIGNDCNVHTEQTTNTWSVGGEGNYWDDYTGKDLNKDGIGDFCYNITDENVDYYPLMGMFYAFVLFLERSMYSITIISNSSIRDFSFKIVAETKARVILFNAKGDYGSARFSRIVIPKALMKSIHAVLVNGEEVNATFLVKDVENIHLYIEHPNDCFIEIVYAELLDWYYQLLSDYSDLLNKYCNLNESNSILLDQYYRLLSKYSELIDAYQSLNESYSGLLNLNLRFIEFNASVNALIEKLNMLNATLDNLLKDYGELQKEFNDVNSLYQNQTQNFKGLIYIFAATTAIFILTVIYFSKKAHEKVESRTTHRNP